MEKLFLELLKVSILCSVGILFVFAVSLLLRRTHTVFWRYCLWILLAVRLAAPFDFAISGQAVVIPIPLLVPKQETSFDVLAERGQKNGAKAEESNLAKDVPAVRQSAEIGEAVNGKRKGDDANVSGAGNYEIRSGEVWQASPDAKQQEDSWEQAIGRASVAWAAGAAVFLIWQFVCYMIFFGRIKKTRVYFGKIENLLVYTSSAVCSPMLMGIRRPQIVLPDAEYTKEELAFILEHEYAHYKRKDLWVRLLLAAAKTIHWFNPLAHCMERHAIQDMELLCDSRVVRYCSREEKKQYGQTLISCASTEKNRITVLCTSEFSRDVKKLKERFANILSGERKKRGVLAVVLGASILLSASLFVVFAAPGKDMEEVSYEPENSESVSQIRLLGLSEEEAARAIYGAVFPRLAYVSDERAILYDYWGLLIYDMKNRRIEQLLDLKEADFNHIQGEQTTHIEVSADGGQILLYNEPNVKERFIYDIEEKRLAYSDLDTFTENHYDGLYERKEHNYALTDTGKTVYLSADSLQTEEGELYHSEDMQGLSLVVTGPDWGESEIFPLFEEYYEKQGDEVVACLKTEDFDRIVGKRYLYEDKDGWSYYLEEDVQKESALWEIAEILEPLLLTRYKDGERQILEDLIYQEVYRECPVLFVDGRIIYKAAQAADIAGVKEASLVSIAADGKDRKIADTVMYRVFDGICEDNGWIYYSGWTNDDTLPKPLCRISPDFSSGAQLVEEISGYLCGVQDGYVYYLAGKEKNSGIWKRNLATGEEQIYDKWGIAAEDIRYFWVRERQFLKGTLRDEEASGCYILFSPNYDGEVFSYRLAFDAASL